MEDLLKATFWGYRRADGGVGVRNHVLAITSVACANGVAERIEREVPEAILIGHQHGCGEMGADLEQTFRVLAGLGRNPNVAAVLVVGLGCETLSPWKLAEEIATSGKHVELLVIQETSGTSEATARGMQFLREMLRETSDLRREEVPLSELVLGTQCGGSDGWSGIAANPALGVASDLVIAAGGTVFLAETTELIGAEHLLAERAISEAVAAEILRVVRRAEERLKAMGVDIRGANPSPGNIAGGISTIEEKSLGCIRKGGTSPILEVVEYGERPQGRGLVIMDTPGVDTESLTGLASGGTQVIVFTTGRGSPVGFPIAPVIKVATNTPLYQRMRENMDLSASAVLERSETIEQVGQRIFQEILAVASGKLTKAELLGHREFALNRIGPTS